MMSLCLSKVVDREFGIHWIGFAESGIVGIGIDGFGIGVNKLIGYHRDREDSYAHQPLEQQYHVSNLDRNMAGMPRTILQVPGNGSSDSTKEHIFLILNFYDTSINTVVLY